MALTYSTMVPLGSPAIDFSLPGTDGNIYSLNSFKNKKVLVVIFMCNHCPYVKAVLQRLIDLQQEFSGKDVQLIGINPNDPVRYPDDSMDNMKKIVAEKNIPFPYLCDERQETARAYGAVCTPDIYVYGEKQTLLYRGRIDNNWEHPEKVTKRDLKEVIDHILSGKEIPGEQIPSMGCSIKWKE
ncbi:MAG: thioredoxin family protein [Nitrospinota bacterium]|nr:thioredoxin family protein [Nitrospinota bacterium]